MLLRGMTEKEVSLCLSALQAQEASFIKGAFIFRAGDTVRKMGIVLSGSVTIENTDLWGNCTILSHVGAGSVFAETYALLSETVLPVDVRANEDCRILFLRMDRLGDLWDDSLSEQKGKASGDWNNGPGDQKGRGPGGRQEGEAAWQNKLLRNLLFISAHKNLTLSGRSFHTAPKSARGRILAYLNTVSLQRHAEEFDIPFDRQQLADYLNLERTNMSKELTRMKNDGLIECKKNHFRLSGTSHRLP